MARPFILPEEKKKTFAMLFLLESMVNADRRFSTLLEGDDKLLEPFLDGLIEQRWADVTGGVYRPTDLGKEKLVLFMKRYSDFLNTLDVYHSVDLTRGEFAMASSAKLDDNAYAVLLADERWEDLRVTVAEYKKLDPVEIVFMSFLNEGRFDTEKSGWQFDLALGTTWNLILDICNSALTMEQLGGEVVLRDVITKGIDVMIDLIRQERARGDTQDPPDAFAPTRVTEVVYYQPYYDPYYVSPYWGGWYY
jgi:hypothetical protein